MILSSELTCFSNDNNNTASLKLTCHVKEILRLLFGAFYFIALAIFMLWSAPVYIFRGVVILLAKVFRPDLGEPLNGQSCIFVNDLFSNKPPRCNIVVCITIKGHLSREEVRNQMILKNWIEATDKKSGDLTYKKFQQYPVRWLGFTFYKNTFKTFDVDKHFYFHTFLGGAKLNYVSEDDVTDFTEELINASFRPRSSPWELHLVHNYKNPKICSDSELSLLILKIHHSLADGYSIFSALSEGLFGHPIGDMRLPVSGNHKRTITSDQVDNTWSLPVRSLYELASSLSNVIRPSFLKIADSDKKWYQYCAKSDFIPISTIKTIKNHFSVSFTSVILAATSAAIHKNLEYKRSSVKKKIREDDGFTFCLSAMPAPGHSRVLTNHATAALLNIPHTDFPSPQHRLYALEAVLDKGKKSAVPYMARIYTTFIGCHFYQVSSFLAKNRWMAAGLTNFPSLPMQMNIGDHPGIAVDFASGGLDGNAGFAVAILSYAQHIRLVVTAEKAVMSKQELNDFIKNINDEVHLLHAEACSTRHMKE